MDSGAENFSAVYPRLVFNDVVFLLLERGLYLILYQTRQEMWYNIILRSVRAIIFAAKEH